MKKNMVIIDRVARIVIALVLIALFFAKAVTGTLGIILLLVAAVFILTGFLGWCPIYQLLGIKTTPKNKTT